MQQFDTNSMSLQLCFPEKTEVIYKEAVKATDDMAFPSSLACDFFSFFQNCI